MVDRAGFEPAYGKPGQIYSLLPLTTRPPVQGASDIGRRLQWRKGARLSTRSRTYALASARAMRHAAPCDARPARRPSPRTGPASGAATRSPPRSPIPSGGSSASGRRARRRRDFDFAASIPVTFADVADLGRLVPRDAPHQGIVAEVERLRRHAARRPARPGRGRPAAAGARPGHRSAQCRRDPALGRGLRRARHRHPGPPRAARIRRARQGRERRARDRALGPGRQPRPRARRDRRGRLLADRPDRRGRDDARRGARARRGSRWCSAPRARACATIPRRIATRWPGCRSAGSKASTSPTPRRSRSTRRASRDKP